MASRANFPVVGSITGNRHHSNIDLLTMGHSLHPLQRGGAAGGPIAPVIPGGPPGGSVGAGPAAAGHVGGFPPLLNLNPIGTLAATRVS